MDRIPVTVAKTAEEEDPGPATLRRRAHRRDVRAIGFTFGVTLILMVFVAAVVAAMLGLWLVVVPRSQWPAHGWIAEAEIDLPTILGLVTATPITLSIAVLLSGSVAAAMRPAKTVISALTFVVSSAGVALSTALVILAFAPSLKALVDCLLCLGSVLINAVLVAVWRPTDEQAASNRDVARVRYLQSVRARRSRGDHLPIEQIPRAGDGSFGSQLLRQLRHVPWGAIGAASVIGVALSAMAGLVLHVVELTPWSWNDMVVSPLIMVTAGGLMVFPIRAEGWAASRGGSPFGWLYTLMADIVAVLVSLLLGLAIAVRSDPWVGLGLGLAALLALCLTWRLGMACGWFRRAADTALRVYSRMCWDRHQATLRAPRRW